MRGHSCDPLPSYLRALTPEFQIPVRFNKTVFFRFSPYHLKLKTVLNLWAVHTQAVTVLRKACSRQYTGLHGDKVAAGEQAVSLQLGRTDHLLGVPAEEPMDLGLHFVNSWLVFPQVFTILSPWLGFRQLAAS